MELSEAREVLELKHDQLLRRWDGESSEWTPSRYCAEAIDTLLAAYDAEKARADAATKDAAAQRERAERAEGERDRLIENYDRGFVVPCEGGWHGAHCEATDSLRVIAPWQYFDTKADAVRFAAGLPAKGAADAATPE